MKTHKTAIVTALGIVLGMAMVASASPAVRSLRLGQQMPTPAAAGETANFLVTVDRAGAGAMNVYLSIAGLPAGATVQFNPSVLRFTDDSPSSKTATMIVTTPANLPAGSYPLTVTARHGASGVIIRADTVLLLAGAKVLSPPPMITAIMALPEGKVQISGQSGAGNIVVLEATLSLETPQWTALSTATADAETGIFQFVDADAAQYSARFYRVGAAQ